MTDSEYLNEIEDWFVNHCGEDNEPLNTDEMRDAIEIVFDILERRRKS